MGRGVTSAEWCKALIVRKIKTSPYKPNTNGMLKRFYRTLNQVVSEGQRDWDEYVQPVMAAYRASEHVVTGFLPNFFILGREVRAMIDLVLGRAIEEADYWDSTSFRRRTSVSEGRAISTQVMSRKVSKEFAWTEVRVEARRALSKM